MSNVGGPGRPSGYPKTGGRKRGTPNKVNDIEAYLDSKGCHPKKLLADFLNGKPREGVQFKWVIEALEFIRPKMKPREVPLNIEDSDDDMDLDAEAIKEQVFGKKDEND